MAELRSSRLSLYYEFGTSLHNWLGDGFVRGLLNGVIQKRQLSEPSLSLAKAAEIALALEAAAKDTLELRGKRV